MARRWGRGRHYGGFAPYVSVAERRAKAEKEMKRLRGKGEELRPVMVEGRTIARTFWGRSWCENLERYGDFANRIPRGRTYVRNGSVIDLGIGEGRVEALVNGSSIYRVTVEVAPLPAKIWDAVKRDCSGAIDSLVELLEGRFARSVMERLCRQGEGLFPAPRELRFDCSCPDYATMCKHVAATLYGVGARFDEDPDLFFRLRGVDGGELIAAAGDGALSVEAGEGDRILQGEDLAALFGIDFAQAEPSPAGQRSGKAKEKTRGKAKEEKVGRSMPGNPPEKVPARAVGKSFGQMSGKVPGKASDPSPARSAAKSGSGAIRNTTMRPSAKRAGKLVPPASEPPSAGSARGMTLDEVRRQLKELSKCVPPPRAKGAPARSVRPEAAPTVRPVSPRRARKDAILAEVRASGPLSRGVVAERFGLSPEEATALLAALVAEGALVRTGERRGTKYDLPKR